MSEQRDAPFRAGLFDETDALTDGRRTHPASERAAGAHSAADWRYLHDAIVGALPDATTRSTRITPFGVRTRSW
jgi:hypothetical protein